MRSRVLRIARALPAIARVPVPVSRLAWAIDTAAHFVPDATCLTQAVVAEALLTRYGYPARVRIGANRTDQQQITGHAWVESGTAIVIGGYDSDERFTEIFTLEGPSTPTR